MKLNTHGMKKEEAESGGGLNVAGWFRAVVDEAGPSEKHPDSEMLFRFKVATGPHKGSMVSQYLPLPESIADASKAATAGKRLLAFASRLGVWDGVTEDPDVDWDECIGNEVVIQTERNEYKDKEGLLKVTYRLTYIGVYPIDHEKIPADQRAGLGLLPISMKDGAAHAPMKKAAGKKKGTDISDL